MDTAFDPAELVQRFIKYANSQSLEERSRILQIIEDSYTTVVISKRRCLCLGCYENKNYYSAEMGVQVLNEGKTALEQSIELFNEKWYKTDEKKPILPFLYHKTVPGKLKITATFEDLNREIQAAITKWKDSRDTITGRIPAFFDSFCQKLNCFRDLGKLIPQESIYTSLFCGAASLIIQASVNHGRMCEGFAQALKEISDEISSVNGLTERTPRLHALACDLYARFFVFFRDAILWFTSNAVKRRLNSFNSDLYETIEESVRDVQRITALIERHTLLLHNETVIDMQKAVNRGLDVLDQKQNVLILQNRVLIEMVKKLLLEDRATKEYRQSMLQFQEEWRLERLERLRGNRASPTMSLDREVDEMPPKDTPVAIISGQSGQESVEPLRHYRRRDLQIASSVLVNHIFQEPRTFMATMKYQYPDIETEVLQEWISFSHSKILWIRKGFTFEYPNSLSVMAATFVDLTLSLQTPVAALFCSWPADCPGESQQEKEHRCLVDMVCSLIRQLVDLLPLEVETEFDLEKEQWLELEHFDDIRPWNVALEILEKLLKLVQSPLFLVIDGIEHMDDTSVTASVKEFLSVLSKVVTQDQKESNPNGETVVKILFTTAGDCRSLLGMGMTLDAVRFDMMEEAQHRPSRQ